MNSTEDIPIKLSVLTLTKNCERTLDNTLKAVHGWADEIVVVDSGSTDSSLAIAEKYGCNILNKEFNGFGEQKSFAVNKSKNNWVFVVDSDEVVTDELKKEISGLLKSPVHKAYLVPITLVFQGKMMKYGQEYKQFTLRLFDKRFGSYNDSKVHENVDVNGSIGKIKNHILHYSYANLHDYFLKFNDYTTAGAIDLFKKGRRTGTMKIVLRFPVQFFQSYFLHLNFLNGYRGYLWALCSSFYPVIKYAKLKELSEK